VSSECPNYGSSELPHDDLSAETPADLGWERQLSEDAFSGRFGHLRQVGKELGRKTQEFGQEFGKRSQALGQRSVDASRTVAERVRLRVLRGDDDSQDDAIDVDPGDTVDPSGNDDDNGARP